MDILKIDPSEENPMPKVAAFLLETVWKIADDVGVCPICLVDMMCDMVDDAYADGKISHVRDPDPEDMGEPPTKTRQ